jgi:uncharacterized protein
MIDWRRVTGFEWDAGNARKNLEKHEVSQSEAEQMFFNDPLLVLADEKHSSIEARVHALGITDLGRQLHVTFTLRHEGTKIRVIAARNMSRKERSYYENPD